MMNRRSWLRISIIAVVSACGPTAPHHGHGDGSGDPNGIPPDVAAALAALPDATVLMFTEDGLPTYIVGDLGRTLPPVLATMRLHDTDLVQRATSIDEMGATHVR